MLKFFLCFLFSSFAYAAPRGHRELSTAEAGMARSATAGNILFNPAGLAKVKNKKLFSVGGSYLSQSKTSSFLGLGENEYYLKPGMIGALYFGPGFNYGFLISNDFDLNMVSSEPIADLSSMTTFRVNLVNMSSFFTISGQSVDQAIGISLKQLSIDFNYISYRKGVTSSSNNLLINMFQKSVTQYAELGYYLLFENNVLPIGISLQAPMYIIKNLNDFKYYYLDQTHDPAQSIAVFQEQRVASNRKMSSQIAVGSSYSINNLNVLFDILYQETPSYYDKDSFFGNEHFTDNTHNNSYSVGATYQKESGVGYSFGFKENYTDTKFNSHVYTMGLTLSNDEVETVYGLFSEVGKDMSSTGLLFSRSVIF